MNGKSIEQEVKATGRLGIGSLAFLVVAFILLSTAFGNLSSALLGSGAASAALGAAASLAITAVLGILWTAVHGRTGLKAFIVTGVMVFSALIALLGQALSESGGVSQIPSSQVSPIIDPFKQQSVTASIESPEDRWNRKITGWEARNADFLSDPGRRQTMAIVLEELDAVTPPIEDDELLRQAEQIAFRRTGWSR